MKKIIIENTKIITIATILSLAVGVASAWTAPATLAPAGNIEAPLSVSASGQIKKCNLIIEGLNSSNVPLINGLIISNGNVGIGTTTPSEKLVINGNLKVINDLKVDGNLSIKGIYSSSSKYAISCGPFGNGETSGGCCRIDTQTGVAECKSYSTTYTTSYAGCYRQPCSGTTVQGPSVWSAVPNAF